MTPIPDATPPDLEALRRQLRWLTAACTFLALAITVLFVYRFIPSDPIVSAERFRLLDKQGRLRGEFASWRDGSPVLRLYGTGGDERMILVANGDGSSWFQISDSLGVRRASLAVGPDRWPTLVLTDHEGNSMVRLSTGPDGKPRARLNEAGGAAVWTAP